MITQKEKDEIYTTIAKWASIMMFCCIVFPTGIFELALHMGWI